MSAEWKVQLVQIVPGVCGLCGSSEHGVIAGAALCLPCNRAIRVSYGLDVEIEADDPEDIEHCDPFDDEPWGAK